MEQVHAHADRLGVNMTSIPEFKHQAAALADHLLRVHGISLKHTHSLHAIAAAVGVANWNSLSATGTAVHPPSGEKLQSHLSSIHGIALSPMDAAAAIASVVAVNCTAPSATTTISPLRAAVPIQFRRGFGDHEWVVVNPNPLAGKKLDSLLESFHPLDNRPLDEHVDDAISEARSLVAGYPGDIEAIHTLATLLSTETRQHTDALMLWRRAWALIEPDLGRVRHEDKSPLVSFNHLDNRPILRAMCGLLSALLQSDSDDDRIEGERLARVTYGLMRDRDSFGLRWVYAEALAGRHQWGKALSWSKRTGGKDEFNTLALQAAAMYHAGHPALATTQQRLIEKHPFAAEVLMRGEPVPDYRKESVSIGTWEEGAAHMMRNAAIWRLNDAWTIWHPYRKRIRVEQERRLSDFWTSHGKLTGQRMRDFYDSVAFVMNWIIPEFKRWRPLSTRVIPKSLPIPTVSVEIADISSLTIDRLNEWEFDRRPRSPVKGAFLEWILHNAIVQRSTTIELNPLERGCEIRFDGTLFATLKRAYSYAAIDVMRVLSSHLYAADNSPFRATVVHGDSRYDMAAVFDRKAVKSTISLTPLKETLYPHHAR